MPLSFCPLDQCHKMSHLSGRSSRSSQAGYQSLDRATRRVNHSSAPHHHQHGHLESSFDGTQGTDGGQWPLPHNKRAKPPRRSRVMTVGAMLRDTLSRASTSSKSSKQDEDRLRLSRDRSHTEVCPGKHGRNSDENVDVTLTSLADILPCESKELGTSPPKPVSSSPHLAYIHSISGSSLKASRQASRAAAELSRSKASADYLEPRVATSETPDGRLSSASTMYRQTLYEAAGKKMPSARGNKPPCRRQSTMDSMYRDSPAFSEEEYRSHWSSELDDASLQAASAQGNCPNCRKSARRYPGNQIMAYPLYENQDPQDIYSNPTLLLNALPSRQIGPLLNGGARVKRGSVKASVSRFDGTVGLRSVASPRDWNPR